MKKNYIQEVREIENGIVISYNVSKEKRKDGLAYPPETKHYYCGDVDEAVEKIKSLLTENQIGDPEPITDEEPDSGPPREEVQSESEDSKDGQ